MICLVHSTARSAISLGENAPPPLVSRRRAVMESSGCFFVFFCLQRGKTLAFPSISAPRPLTRSFLLLFFQLHRHVMPATSQSVGAGQHSSLVGHSADTHTHTHIGTKANSHGFGTLTRLLTHALAHSRALAEGQHSEANLIGVFMCSVSLCPCLFHTSCHHVPSPSLSAPQSLLSADAPEKHSGPKQKQKKIPRTKKQQQQILPFVFGLCSQSLLRIWGL